MSAHRVLHDMHNAPYLMSDPGASGTITVDRQFANVPVVTAAAEARTLAQPTKAGLYCTVVLDTDGGDCTLTVTGGYNAAGSTSITLDDAGDFVTFQSIKVGASYYWRVADEEGSSVSDVFSSITCPVLIMTGTTGNQEIRLTANLADALSIEDTTGDLVVFTTTTNALAIGIAKTVQTNHGVKADLSGSGFTLTSTRDLHVGAFADDGGASIGASVRNILGRTLLTYDQTGGSIRSVMGQLKILTNIDVTSGIYTGVQGYLELVGTHSAKTGSTLSCIDASLEIGTALTIDSGGEACGIHIETTGSGTITNNGTCAALLIDKASGAASWPNGIRIKPDSATVGILVGTTPTQNAAGQVDGSGIPLTASRLNAVEVNADTGSTNLNGDYYVSAIKGNVILGTTSSNASIVAVLGTLNTNTANFGSGDHYAVRGHLDFWGSSTLAGANNNTGAISAYVENEATTTVSAGNVLCGLQVYQVGGPTLAAGTYPAGGMNPGIWLRANALAAAWQTGIYMPVNSVKTAIRVGNWVGSGATGSAIAFATASHDVYADGQLDLVAVFGESSSNLTSAYSAKCGRFRHLVSGSSLTVAHETYGLLGQLCAKGVTMTHLHGGLMGTFEATGAAIVLNSSYTTGGHGCVIARPGLVLSNITATTPLAGFLAFNNASANLASGTLAAFMTSVRDTTYKWTYGLYIPSGTCTQAIEIASTVANTGRLVKMSGTVTAPSHGDGYGAMEYELNITGTAAGQTAASSTWINMAASSSGGSQTISVRDDGIWSSATGTPLASAKCIIGGRMQFVVEGGGNPGSLFLWATNISDNQVTALFDINTIIDFNYSSGAGSSGGIKIPFLKERSTGTTYYMSLYTS